uniref:Gamma tubulin complex component C-terminal domain-containing protein n=1 Tax=Chromera velia CCMP2878 TaxID=1169474 RepID=A0A0G4HZ87_9ALVE|eukprot:Cvel_9673.t1-p1 / transcript=Cvel_9673.t1 / gene=Cvel_9673 / organism=Chromera_velia_CCMP2878 / gene_product=hypothetical protein / transcript_product=hypothetical protein / location=Cvel_scaffold563:45744-56131(+) / protein_length=1925 / sequence_SO=supercontig / SO=protein_coding / is_pseudo=false
MHGGVDFKGLSVCFTDASTESSSSADEGPLGGGGHKLPFIKSVSASRIFGTSPHLQAEPSQSKSVSLPRDVKSRGCSLFGVGSNGALLGGEEEEEGGEPAPFDFGGFSACDLIKSVVCPANSAVVSLEGSRSLGNSAAAVQPLSVLPPSEGGERERKKFRDSIGEWAARRAWQRPERKGGEGTEAVARDFLLPPGHKQVQGEGRRRSMRGEGDERAKSYWGMGRDILLPLPLCPVGTTDLPGFGWDDAACVLPSRPAEFSSTVDVLCESVTEEHNCAGLSFRVGAERRRRMRHLVGGRGEVGEGVQKIANTEELGRSVWMQGGESAASLFLRASAEALLGRPCAPFVQSCAGVDVPASESALCRFDPLSLFLEIDSRRGASRTGRSPTSEEEDLRGGTGAERRKLMGRDDARLLCVSAFGSDGLLRAAGEEIASVASLAMQVRTAGNREGPSLVSVSCSPLQRAVRDASVAFEEAVGRSLESLSARAERQRGTEGENGDEVSLFAGLLLAQLRPWVPYLEKLVAVSRALGDFASFAAAGERRRISRERNGTGRGRGSEELGAAVGILASLAGGEAAGGSLLSNVVEDSGLLASALSPLLDATRRWLSSLGSDPEAVSLLPLLPHHQALRDLRVRCLVPSGSSPSSFQALWGHSGSSVFSSLDLLSFLKKNLEGATCLLSELQTYSPRRFAIVAAAGRAIAAALSGRSGKSPKGEAERIAGPSNDESPVERRERQQQQAGMTDEQQQLLTEIESLLEADRLQAAEVSPSLPPSAPPPASAPAPQEGSGRVPSRLFGCSVGACIWRGDDEMDPREGGEEVRPPWLSASEFGLLRSLTNGGGVLESLSDSSSLSLVDLQADIQRAEEEAIQRLRVYAKSASTSLAKQVPLLNPPRTPAVQVPQAGAAESGAPVPRAPSEAAAAGRGSGPEADRAAPEGGGSGTLGEGLETGEGDQGGRTEGGVAAGAQGDNGKSVGGLEGVQVDAGRLREEVRAEMRDEWTRESEELDALTLALRWRLERLRLQRKRLPFLREALDPQAGGTGERERPAAEAAGAPFERRTGLYRPQGGGVRGETAETSMPIGAAIAEGEEEELLVEREGTGGDQEEKGGRGTRSGLPQSSALVSAGVSACLQGDASESVLTSEQRTSFRPPQTRKQPAESAAGLGTVGEESAMLEGVSAPLSEVASEEEEGGEGVREEEEDRQSFEDDFHSASSEGHRGDGLSVSESIRSDVSVPGSAATEERERRAERALRSFAAEALRAEWGWGARPFGESTLDVEGGSAGPPLVGSPFGEGETPLMPPWAVVPRTDLGVGLGVSAPQGDDLLYSVDDDLSIGEEGAVEKGQEGERGGQEGLEKPRSKFQPARIVDESLSGRVASPCLALSRLAGAAALSLLVDSLDLRGHLQMLKDFALHGFRAPLSAFSVAVASRNSAALWEWGGAGAVDLAEGGFADSANAASTLTTAGLGLMGQREQVGGSDLVALGRWVNSLFWASLQSEGTNSRMVEGEGWEEIYGSERGEGRVGSGGEVGGTPWQSVFRWEIVGRAQGGDVEGEGAEGSATEGEFFFPRSSGALGGWGHTEVERALGRLCPRLSVCRPLERFFCARVQEKYGRVFRLLGLLAVGEQEIRDLWEWLKRHRKVREACYGRRAEEKARGGSGGASSGPRASLRRSWEGIVRVAGDLHLCFCQFLRAVSSWLFVAAVEAPHSRLMKEIEEARKGSGSLDGLLNAHERFVRVMMRRAFLEDPHDPTGARPSPVLPALLACFRQVGVARGVLLSCEEPWGLSGDAASVFPAGSEEERDALGDEEKRIATQSRTLRRVRTAFLSRCREVCRHVRSVTEDAQGGEARFSVGLDGNDRPGALLSVPLALAYSYLTETVVLPVVTILSTEIVSAVTTYFSKDFSETTTAKEIFQTYETSSMTETSLYL